MIDMDVTDIAPRAPQSRGVKAWFVEHHTALVGSLLMHGLLLAIFLASSPSEDKPRPAKTYQTIEARLWRPSAPVTVNKIPALPEPFPVAEKDIETLTVNKRKEGEPPRKENVSSFDDLLAKAQTRVKSAEERPLSESDLSSVMPLLPPAAIIEDEPEEIVVNTPTTQAQPAASNNQTQPYKEEMVMDPLLLYQQKLALELQRNLRLTPAIRGKRCVLGMELTRDGLVLHSYHVNGSHALCQEAQVAAQRMGKLPMPKERRLFSYLNKLKITVITGAMPVLTASQSTKP